MAELTRQDIVKYIFKIRLNFENAYPTRNDFEMDLLVESWIECLGCYSKELCDIALSNALSNAKFVPRLGDITAEIKKLLEADRKSDIQLWEELKDCFYTVYDTSRYLQYEQHYEKARAKLDQIYDSLDEDIKLYVVNRSVLVELSCMNAEQLNYEKARFLKSMPELRQHKADYQQIQRLALRDGGILKLLENKK